MEQFTAYIRKLYPSHADKILSEIKKYKNSSKEIDIPLPNDVWYKYANFYCVYLDSFASKNSSSIARMAKELPRIRELGINAVHFLPFLESPMVDKGFDVANYTKIRSDLGTMSEMKQLIEVARVEGIKVFMDLVFNHVSDQHEWFQKAQNGNEKYRDYFISHKTKPEFIRKLHKDSAVWAEYNINGEKRLVNIAFPEQEGEIPHWRQGKDGYWYYHTYYPQQLDVNWHNPDVYIEFAKILIFWASIGFNFRLDAIPFVGKSAYKDVDENSNFTQTLLASLNCLGYFINPETVFIVETYEKEETVIEYFGNTNHKQAALSYNFHLCTYLWVALVKEDASYVWEKLRGQYKIPTHAHWVNFLRNHDELSLAYLSDPLLKEVSDSLLPNGQTFREGYGISGRTYSLLGESSDKFLSAYFLLCSLPGGVLIPYGDELGKKNIPITKLTDMEKADSRNINRGSSTNTERNQAKSKSIKKKLTEFLQLRSHLREYINVWPQEIKSCPEVFAASYQSGSSDLIVFVNLSQKRQIVTINTKEYKTLFKLKRTVIQENKIIIPAYGGIWLQK